jgi:hypothetical protein
MEEEAKLSQHVSISICSQGNTVPRLEKWALRIFSQANEPDEALAPVLL